MAIAKILNFALWSYMWIIIIRALISWVSPDPYNPIVRFLVAVTEPVLYPIRKRVPYLGGIDFSPFIVVLVIIFLQVFAVNSLTDWAVSIRLSHLPR
jgi:YggT family protein